LAEDVIVEDFVILGAPPRGHQAGDLALIIGAGSIIRSHSVIYAGSTIGAGFQTGHHVMLREANTIGDKVSIGTNSVIEHHIIFEEGVRVHSCVFIPEYSLLQRGAWVGPNVVVTNALYPLSPEAKTQLKGATLRPHAKVGANATLLPGVVIGESALVGAGTVVTKDVPDGKVVVGNPMRIINDISKLPYHLEE
jgi:acetyltransferase-like isoleucine patch superfamily enzyme